MVTALAYPAAVIICTRLDLLTFHYKGAHKALPLPEDLFP